MHRITRNLRGLLVALATLGLSAGAVFAARPASVEAPPPAAVDGLTQASEASGKTVPVQPDLPALPEVEEDGDEEGDAPVVEGDVQVQPTVVGERPQNHGWFVSEAAKVATPDGFDNHGEYVSEIARGDEGKPEVATTAGQGGAAAAAAAKTRKAERAAVNGNR